MSTVKVNTDSILFYSRNPGVMTTKDWVAIIEQSRKMPQVKELVIGRYAKEDEPSVRWMAERCVPHLNVRFYVINAVIPTLFDDNWDIQGISFIEKAP